MMVRLTIEGIEGHWDVEIPQDDPIQKYADKKLEESAAMGWDAVQEFEAAVQDAVRSELHVDVVIPNAEAHQTPERSVGGMVPPLVGNSGLEDGQ